MPKVRIIGCLFMLVVFVSLCSPRAFSGGSDAEEITLSYQGDKRFYYLHVPSGYSPDKKVPLVFAFHGGGGNGRIMANDEYYGWISKSEKEGFIVAFPTGSTRFRKGRLATWNAGRCCGYARDEKKDDAGFIKAVIEDIQKDYSVDDKNIFAAGMSNGGMFSYYLACALPGTFRAIAAVAGTDTAPECAISQGISVLHIHAKNDDHVLYNGGAGKNAFRDVSSVTDFGSVADTISKWTGLNLCQTSPQKTLEVDGAYCEEYSGCRDNSSVKLCVTEDGGHSWPGAAKTPMKKSSPPSTAINATDVIWDFFKAHQR